MPWAQEVPEARGRYDEAPPSRGPASREHTDFVCVFVRIFVCVFVHVSWHPGEGSIAEMAARLPAAKVRHFSGAGHSIHNTNREEFVAALITVVDTAALETYPACYKAADDAQKSAGNPSTR